MSDRNVSIRVVQFDASPLLGRCTGAAAPLRAPLAAAIAAFAAFALGVAVPLGLVVSWADDGHTLQVLDPDPDPNLHLDPSPSPSPSPNPDPSPEPSPSASASPSPSLSPNPDQVLERPKPPLNAHPISGTPSWFSSLHSQVRRLRRRSNPNPALTLAITLARVMGLTLA